MRIGKQDEPLSAISTATPDRIIVRGRDLCHEIIGKVDFTSYFWRLVTGADPSPRQKLFTDAVLTAIAEHGLVPSVAAARMTYAAAPEAFQGAVAAGLLGCGSVILGSAEACGRLLDRFVREAAAEGLSSEAVAERGVKALRAERMAIPGFGHPLHSEGDPRAETLLAMAEEHGAAGAHVRMLYCVRDAVPLVMSRSLAINVNGAIPAIMLDVGFPLNALKGVSILARTAGLIAHLQEESERPIGFVLSGKAAEAIGYDGPDFEERSD
jgi:citrate synthase